MGSHTISHLGKRITRHIAGAAILLAAAIQLACATVSVHRFEPKASLPQPTERVLLLEELPSTPYRALARIEVRDRGRGVSVETLQAQLVEAASKLGADAVVLEPTSTPRGVFVIPGVVSLYDDLTVAGTAIAFAAKRS